MANNDPIEAASNMDPGELLSHANETNRNSESNSQQQGTLNNSRDFFDSSGTSGSISLDQIESDADFLKLLGVGTCLLYTSPSPRDKRQSRMPSSA